MPRKATAKRRRRDYAAEYRRRQERARSRGFESYYQERIRGGAKASPDTPPPGPEVRRRRAGHGGRSAFLDYIREGDVVMRADHLSRIERAGSGRYVAIEKLVVPEDPERPTRRFVMHGLTKAQLARMIEAELQAGAVLTPVPSLDQRRLL